MPIEHLNHGFPSRDAVRKLIRSQGKVRQKFIETLRYSHKLAPLCVETVI